jgi:hypothetical protein
MAKPLIVKRGDTQPPYLAKLAYLNDDLEQMPVDLTGATVKVLAQGDTAGMPSINRTATGNDQGEVRMDWQTGDTAVAGRFRTEIQVTFPDLSVLTFPAGGYLEIVVTPDLGS